MQLTLNFDAGLTDSFSSCREYTASIVHRQGVSQKAIAADMDYSPSTLSRKLAQSPDDSQRFTLDDLENFIDVTGDTSPVVYLVEKYLTEKDEDALKRQIRSLQEQLDKQRAAG